MPPATHALAWVPRIQHTVAQVLAQIDTGWEGSARRSALLSVLLGPTDWTTSAAIAALAWIARREPALSQDIHRQFEILERHIPTSGYCCYAETLYEHWAELPYLFDSEREALLTKRKALED
jgi:hypothetical protein